MDLIEPAADIGGSKLVCRIWYYGSSWVICFLDDRFGNDPFGNDRFENDRSGTSNYSYLVHL